LTLWECELDDLDLIKRHIKKFLGRHVSTRQSS
jgi:hypothetical protein